TPRPTLLPYTTLFRSIAAEAADVPGHPLQRKLDVQQPQVGVAVFLGQPAERAKTVVHANHNALLRRCQVRAVIPRQRAAAADPRSEEHTSELQSRENL